MNLKIIVALVSLLSISQTLLAGEILSEKLIKETFSGKTIQWKHLYKGTSGKSFYAKDGKLIRIANGSKEVGTWSTNKNTLCSSLVNKCTYIESDGNGGFYRIMNLVSRKALVHITSVTDGNAL